ncbi:MAG: hypothetical protein JOZ39_08290 [Chloroflexi bacterium]|nr:hypothetical protein [Chloroflexota bacterium]
MDQREAPDADAFEQALPAGGEDGADPLEQVVAGAAPEADALEQATPAAPNAAYSEPTFRREPLELIPEADRLEQEMPAGRDLFDERD